MSVSYIAMYGQTVRGNSPFWYEYGQSGRRNVVSGKYVPSSKTFRFSRYRSTCELSVSAHSLCNAAHAATCEICGALMNKFCCSAVIEFRKLSGTMHHPTLHPVKQWYFESEFITIATWASFAAGASNALAALSVPYSIWW